jgi:hypothetical protein
MEAADELNWQRPAVELDLYLLKKRANIQNLKDALDLENESLDPVSDQEFLRELKALILAEFLEVVM